MLEKNVTFRSSIGMLQALIMLIDLVIKNKLRRDQGDLIKYRLKRRLGYSTKEKSILKTQESQLAPEEPKTKSG